MGASVNNGFTHRMALLASARIPPLKEAKTKKTIYQCSRSEIINYGSGSSSGKSGILDPDPGSHPITDQKCCPDLEPHHWIGQNRPFTNEMTISGRRAKKILIQLERYGSEMLPRSGSTTLDRISGGH